MSCDYATFANGEASTMSPLRFERKGLCATYGRRFGSRNVASKGWHAGQGHWPPPPSDPPVAPYQIEFGPDLDTLPGGARGAPRAPNWNSKWRRNRVRGVNFAVKFKAQIAASKRDRKMSLLINYYLGPKMRSHFKAEKRTHFLTAFLDDRGPNLQT